MAAHAPHSLHQPRTYQEMAERFIDFSTKGPRSYRGTASWDGHDGSRAKDGTWAKSNVSRKRWTTALHEDALDKLHDLAKYAGVNRCEIVEAMLMSPQCRDLALKAIEQARG